MWRQKETHEDDSGDGEGKMWMQRETYEDDSGDGEGEMWRQKETHEGDSGDSELDDSVDAPGSTGLSLIPTLIDIHQLSDVPC